MSALENGCMNCCQSCGIPMGNGDDIGLNYDGTGNPDYCTYCYHEGEFTELDMTVEEMIEKSSQIIHEIGFLSKGEAKQISLEIIPSLKRWK
jgi:hypothetical protein